MMFFPLNESTKDTYPPGAVPFDFETRAPWYFYNESAEILPGKTAGATYLPVIQSFLGYAFCGSWVSTKN
jgi:hypothetical protein